MNKTLLPLPALAAGLIFIVSTACTSRPTYQCSTNTACVSETGAPGICEANGFCSFQDTACTDSGRKYSDGAGSGLEAACVTVPASQKCIETVGLGTTHTCIVKTDGSLWCWGQNDHGQLGDGTTQSRSVPTRVTLPGNVKVATVTAGEDHTCALDADGGIWCWGDNSVGQLGISQSETKVPVKVAFEEGGKAIAAKLLIAGGKHTCAVADARLFCWGENSDGQCGADPANADDVLVPTEVAGLEGVVEVASGDEFTCARRDDKSVFCFGANADGELGNGTTTPSFTPVKVNLTSVGQLTAGDEHACGVKDDGSVWCWGYGQSGALGTGTQDNKPSPVAVGTAKAVFASGQSFHTCSVNANGALSCWGANDAQQIGAGAAGPNVLSPSEVSLITVKMAAPGGKHTCALTFDGTLWCWGANDVGQLGTGSTGATVALPQRIPISCP